MSRKLSIKDEVTEFLLYTAPGGKVRVEVLLNNETLWLTQKRMAELFGVGVPAISKHLRNIFECAGGANWMKIQLFPFWKQLRLTVRTTRPDITTLMR